MPPAVGRDRRTPDPIAAAVDDELRLHLEHRTAELVATGLSQEAAAARALREFGDLEASRAELRRVDEAAARRATAAATVAAIGRDLLHAARLLLRRPGFAMTAIGTLALGIGASTAIFSVVQAVLLRPLPYPDADRLVLLWGDLRNRQVYDFPVAPGDVPDIRRGASLFEEITAVAGVPQPLVDGSGEPEQVQTVVAMPNLFRMLGGQIVAGRDFAPEDAAPQPVSPQAADLPNQPLAPVANALPQMLILSHDFWTRRYGADPGVIGRSVELGGARSLIVGVVAPEFRLFMPPAAVTPASPSIYRALRVNYEAGSRTIAFLRIIARLRPGASLHAAQSQLDTVAADLRGRFPVKQGSGWHYRLEPMHDDVVADVRPSVLALMGAALLVLVVACANVGNLLLVRSSARAQEMAVRMALGGSRASLVRQVFAESALVSLLGAALGVAVARMGTQLLLALAPAALPREAAVDLAVLGFAVIAALVSAGLFGAAPAIAASRHSASELLRARGSVGAAAHGRGLRNGVVILEVALSFMLLIGSGLMWRSLAALHDVDPGFDSKGLLTALVPNPVLPSNEARAAFKRQLYDRLLAVPGVTAVTATSPLPLDGTNQSLRWGPEAALADPSQFQQADVHFVLPGYFEAMRTPLVRGRTFTPTDNRPEAAVLVVDELFAAKAFPGVDPIGRRLLARVRTSDPEWFTVIGVVRHQHQSGLADRGRDGVFIADGFVGHGAANRWVLRTAGDPALLAGALAAAVKAVDPTVPVADVRPMTDRVRAAMAETRFALALIAVFAAIAVVLATVGLYGVLSTIVRQRTSEIGVRMTFGAAPRRVFGLVLRHGLSLTVAGICLGLLGSRLVTVRMASMLVNVAPTDRVTYVATIVLFSVVALVACAVPARRAARLDPVSAMRE